MKTTDFLKEDIATDAHEMHLDHEVQMARKDCYTAADDAIALHKLLRHVSESQGIEGWVAAKITLASDYLKSVREHLEYQLMSTAGQSAEADVVLPIAEGMLDTPGQADSPAAQAIIRRILLQRTDLLAKYGPEKVGAAVDEVADFIGDVEEIGSSDVSGWVRHVEQMLGNMGDDVAEGYYDLNDEGMQPIDLSANPSFKQLVNRYTQLYYQGHEGTYDEEESAESDAIEQYVAKRFGQKGSDHLLRAAQASHFGRDDGRGSGHIRSSNLGRPSQPAGDFRTTKAGKMHSQDAKGMKNKVTNRLGRHPEPNLPEGVAEGVAETLPMHDAVKVLRQYGADHFKTTSNELHFYKQGRPFSVDLIWGNEGERSVNLSQLNSATRGLKGQGVEEGIGDTIKRGVKSVKRGMQGWGQLNDVPDDDPRLLPGAKDTPRQLVARNKGYDDKTVKQLARPVKSSFPFGGDDTTSPHSPRGLQKRVLDREMKKRGLDEQGVAEAQNDYFKRRKDEEDRISGTKAPAKRTPKQTDYEKKRRQQSVAEMSSGSVATVVNPTLKNKAKVGSLFGGTYKQAKAK
jgi:hypothetical protein